MNRLDSRLARLEQTGGDSVLVYLPCGLSPDQEDRAVAAALSRAGLEPRRDDITVLQGWRDGFEPVVIRHAAP